MRKTFVLKIADRKTVKSRPRETAVKNSHTKVPGPHHYQDASTWAEGAGAKAPTPHRARARDLGSSQEA